MLDLLWFSGISWDTPIREIGWTYVVLAGLLVTLVVVVRKGSGR